MKIKGMKGYTVKIKAPSHAIPCQQVPFIEVTSINSFLCISPQIRCIIKYIYIYISSFSSSFPTNISTQNALLFFLSTVCSISPRYFHVSVCCLNLKGNFLLILQCGTVVIIRFNFFFHPTKKQFSSSLRLSEHWNNS